MRMVSEDAFTTLPASPTMMFAPVTVVEVRTAATPVDVARVPITNRFAAPEKVTGVPVSD
ncbi:MAG: hypothetical protein ACRC14_19790 [Paracoccaceae bacterium]